MAVIGNWGEDTINPLLLVLVCSIFVVLFYLVSPVLLPDDERLTFFLALPAGVLLGFMNRRKESRI